MPDVESCPHKWEESYGQRHCALCATEDRDLFMVIHDLEKQFYALRKHSRWLQACAFLNRSLTEKASAQFEIEEIARERLFFLAVNADKIQGMLDALEAYLSPLLSEIEQKSIEDLTIEGGEEQ